MHGDQLYFLGLAAILVFTTLNGIHFNCRYGWIKGESRWLWGMAFLASSCLSFGISPWIGVIGLTLGNVAIVGSYLALIYQLRFWRDGNAELSWKAYLFIVLYLALLEYSRYFLPYAARSTVIHGSLSVLTGYLFWSTIRLYQRTKLQQLLFLASTFGTECACAILRTIYPFTSEVSSAVSLYSEPYEMKVVRWVWATANAITYLTIMMYQLEKATNKKENLESLIAEKDQLLRATTLVSRANNASVLTGSIMHELRQPLSTILLGSSSLRKSTDHRAINSETIESVSRYAEVIEKESLRSMAIMNKLEQVYSPDRLTFQRVFLPELVENTLSLLENRIQNNQVKIEKFYQSSAEVMGDMLQLESVVTNLVSNAIKALEQAPPLRVIKIWVKEHNEKIILEVRDNGRGIDPSILPNIFSLFVSQGEGGIGIGLWLSRIIMENHHGEIQCKNMAGGGASFMIAFPIAKDSPPNATLDTQ